MTQTCPQAEAPTTTQSVYPAHLNSAGLVVYEAGDLAGDTFVDGIKTVAPNGNEWGQGESLVYLLGIVQSLWFYLCAPQASLTPPQPVALVPGAEQTINFNQQGLA